MAERITAPVVPEQHFRDDAPGDGRARRPAAEHIRSHHARIGDVDAHWLAAGRGSPVVLVHGLGNSSLVWRRVIQGLAPHHLVIAPDLPGFGHSSPARRRPLLRAYDEFLAELIERAAPGQRAAVVGNSVGGAVALRLAATHPALVSRLVLVDPAGVGQGIPAWWSLVRFEPLVRLVSAVPLSLTPRPVLERVIGEAYRRMAFADPANVSERSVHLFAERLNSRARIHRFLRNAHDVVDAFRSEVQDLEAPVDVPVLAIWGRQDRLVPLSDALALLERIGGLEVRIIDDAGHSPQLEAPEAFLDAVGPFLDRGALPRSHRHDTSAIRVAATDGHARGRRARR
ncbi:MAG TPA: alpha/beta fold hydrolase [Candidatus Angelobacter sp.]|jgi:pimeloyl-ACP methyl ester carboxylesterase|nr:alpha/beta fold hydrolase [Candidatus Angelobacter sp.]